MEKTLKRVVIGLVCLFVLLLCAWGLERVLARTIAIVIGFVIAIVVYFVLVIRYVSMPKGKATISKDNSKR